MSSDKNSEYTRSIDSMPRVSKPSTSKTWFPPKTSLEKFVESHSTDSELFASMIPEELMKKKQIRVRVRSQPEQTSVEDKAAGSKPETEKKENIEPSSDDGTKVETKESTPILNLKSEWYEHTESFRVPKGDQVTRVVLVRSGTSSFREKGYLDNWLDYDLGPEGRRRVEDLAIVFLRKNYKFDKVYTSCMSRARNTARLILEATGQRLMGVSLCWRLNPRLYGTFTGKSEDGMMTQWGKLTPWFWKEHGPLPMTENHPHFFNIYRSPTYKSVKHLSLGENMLDMFIRAAPVWCNEINNEIIEGKRSILVCGHGDSLCGLLAVVMGLTSLDFSVWKPSYDVPIEMYFQRGSNSSLQLQGFSFIGNKNQQEEEVSRFTSMLKKRLENSGTFNRNVYNKLREMIEENKPINFEKIVKICTPKFNIYEKDCGLKELIKKHPKGKKIHTKFKKFLKQLDKDKICIVNLLKKMKEEMINTVNSTPGYQEKILGLREYLQEVDPCLRNFLCDAVKRIIKLVKEDKMAVLKVVQNARKAKKILKDMEMKKKKDLLNFKVRKSWLSLLEETDQSSLFKPVKKLFMDFDVVKKGIGEESVYGTPVIDIVSQMQNTDSQVKICSRKMRKCKPKNPQLINE